MKKTWNKPTIQKINIQKATLSGAGKQFEKVNGGDVKKRPLVS